MDELRNENGYIVLDKSMLSKLISLKLSIFNYKGKKYYAKVRDNPVCFNELITEELAKDYGLNCAHYDIAIYNSKINVISEDFVKDNTYIPMYNIINSDFENNTLEKIWTALESIKFNKRYLTQNEVEYLMNKIIDIFIFDILIANVDRNPYNYGLLIKDNKIDVAPVFDNEAFLFKDSLKDSNFSIKVDDNLSGNTINYFLNLSSKEYFEKFKNKLSIIDEENIIKVFSRVEERTKMKMSKIYKDDVLSKFKINKEKLLKIIDEVENKNIRKV